MPGEAPRALTLDLFGTLVDFSLVRDERPLVAELLDDAGEDANPGDVLGTWVEASLRERARTPFRTVRASIEHGARVTRERHELAIEPSYWASALETLWATRPLREETPRALQRLEEASVPWAIVSNVDEPVLEALLRRTGLASTPEVVVSSHQARAYKPHPRPFRMALTRLGVGPSDAAHVGDDPAEDRAGARAAGMRSLLFDPELRSLEDAVVSLLEGAD